MNELQVLEVMQAGILGVLTFVWSDMRKFREAYAAEKGKNRAAAEDIAKLTRLVEEVRAEFMKGLEAERAAHQKSVERFKDALEWESKRREQAGKVARVLSLWARTGPMVDASAIDALSEAYTEVAMVLDETALRELTKTLRWVKGSTYKTAVVAARKVLVGPADGIQPDDITDWEHARVGGMPGGR